MCQDWLDEQKLRATRSSTQKPIAKIENFYVAGPPLTPAAGKMFVGRKQIFENIQEVWKNPLMKSPVVLHGQRRMGKTSLLYHLGERLKQLYYCVDQLSNSCC